MRLPVAYRYDRWCGALWRDERIHDGRRRRSKPASSSNDAELPNFEGVIGHLAEAINLSITMGTPLNLTPSCWLASLVLGSRI